MDTHNAGGFSMIELLIVVGVLAIIAAMTIPAYMSYLRNYRVRNDCTSISSLIYIARMRAGSDFARVALNCDPTAQPAVCRLYSQQYSPTASSCAGTWTLEPQRYYLSATALFGIPSTATQGVGGQSTPTQGSPTATAVNMTSGTTSGTTSLVTSGSASTYTLIFNSRGWPIDCNNNPIADYALYLTDQPGKFSMALGIGSTGRPQIYVSNNGSYSTNSISN